MKLIWSRWWQFRREDSKDIIFRDIKEIESRIWGGSEREKV